MQNIPNSLMKSHEARVERFMDRVLPEPNSGCWLWLGEIRKDGYGECWTFARRERAHQAAYREIACKEVPEGQMLRHRCDTPLCANPDHLVPGTQAENMADKVARDRQAKGTQHGMNKLTEEQVREIRTSPLSQRVLARKFDLHQTMISRIRLRKAWAHLD